MRNTVLALCALSLLGGCGGQYSVAQSNYDDSLPRFDVTEVAWPPIQLYTPETCPAINKKSYSPSADDEKRFIQRLDTDKQYMEIAINLSCIRKLYSKKEIIKWKDAGDPVAILVYLDTNYRNYKKLCKNYNDVKSLLVRAQQVKVQISGNKYNIIRTPEAYIIEVSIDYECRGIEKAGFFYKELERHNVSPEFFNHIVY
jgi:hypothetical protein